MTLVLASVAGGLGAGLRYVIDVLVRRRVPCPFPVGTFLINLLGCFLLGWLNTASEVKQWQGQWQFVLGTGFCGGFTTFSTVSVEIIRLLQERKGDRAFATFMAMVAGCVTAVCAGAFIGIYL